MKVPASSILLEICHYFQRGTVRTRMPRIKPCTSQPLIYLVKDADRSAFKFQNESDLRLTNDLPPFPHSP